METRIKLGRNEKKEKRKLLLRKAEARGAGVWVGEEQSWM